jgi:hypothetical protein
MLTLLTAAVQRVRALSEAAVLFRLLHSFEFAQGERVRALTRLVGGAGVTAIYPSDANTAICPEMGILLFLTAAIRWSALCITPTPRCVQRIQLQPQVSRREIYLCSVSARELRISRGFKNSLSCPPSFTSDSSDLIRQKH